MMIVLMDDCEGCSSFSKLIVLSGVSDRCERKAVINYYEKIKCEGRDSAPNGRRARRRNRYT
jgi:hypothetical protein